MSVNSSLLLYVCWLSLLQAYYIDIVYLYFNVNQLMCVEEQLVVIYKPRQSNEEHVISLYNTITIRNYETLTPLSTCEIVDSYVLFRTSI